AESGMAPDRGGRLARRTWEQEEDPRRRGLRIPLHDPTAETDDLGSMKRLARVREHLPPCDRGVRLDEIVAAEVQMPYDRGVPRSIGESPLDEFSQPAMGQVVADEQDRPVEREVIVARQVAARDTRRATAGGRLRFLHFDGAIGRVTQAAAGRSAAESRAGIDSGVPFDGGTSSGCRPSRGPKKLPLTRICSRGSSVRSDTKSASA